MKIIIDIGHPAQVHYFRNFISIMESKGHSCFVIARDKEVTFELLRNYNIKYESRGKGGEGQFKKILYIFKADYLIYRFARKVKPDLFLSFGSTYAGHVSFLFKKPHIVFDDSENASLERKLYKPFADIILTPSCYSVELGRKQIKFSGFMELCYLNPRYSNADFEINSLLGVKPQEKYVILRFVSWNASHDVGHSGMSLDFKHALVELLSKQWKVFISSEAPLTEEFLKFKLNIPPYLIHDVLANATLFIGEGATMASECAILGTPAIYTNSITNGYIAEHTQNGSVFRFQDSKSVQEKALEILSSLDPKIEFRKNRDKILNEKIDVTAFMVWFIENYPTSAKTMKANPDFQFTFK